MTDRPHMPGYQTGDLYGGAEGTTTDLGVSEQEICDWLTRAQGFRRREKIYLLREEAEILEARGMCTISGRDVTFTDRALRLIALNTANLRRSLADDSAYTDRELAAGREYFDMEFMGAMRPPCAWEELSAEDKAEKIRKGIAEWPKKYGP